MADAEQFSLRWNNFHSNLSEGFHSLLEEVDLVDVTLAAEGQYLQAHKLVLSVCSPYFKQLFKANPCKHPIVILKDVCHKDLEALLQFMYQGEVNVRQEELAPFLKTAEMLQIKGLTGNDSKPSMPDSPKQTRVQTPPPSHRVGRDPVKQESQNSAETSRPFKRQRTESPHIGTGSLTSSSATHSAPATTATTSQPSAMSPTETANVEFVPISNPKLEPLEYDNEADGSKESPADLVQLLHSNESSQPPPDLPPAEGRAQPHGERLLGRRPLPLGPEEQRGVPSDRMEKRKTCATCPAEKKRKTAYMCIVCKKAICLECSRKLCLCCTKKIE